MSGNVASGTLNGSSISLSGTKVSPTPASVVDGSSPVFNRADFSPPLPRSDAIHFVGSSGSSYTLQFGSPVTNPVLHLGSLASTLEFPAGTEITRLSGDAGFSVSGNSVGGALEPPVDDANGSLRLSGRFTSISFSTTFPGSDGIYLQVGASPPLPSGGAGGSAPPPAPVVKSITPAPQTPPKANQPLVLTARVAGNFKRLLWNLDADPAPEAVGRGPAATSLLFRPKPGPLNVSVRAIGSGGASTSLPQRLGVGPPPTLTSRASKTAFSFAQKKPPVYVTGPPGIAIPPISVLKPEDLKDHVHCGLRPLFGYTGNDTTLQAGGLEIRGCLVPVTDVSQINERERGMLVALAEKLNLRALAAEPQRRPQAARRLLEPQGHAERERGRLGGRPRRSDPHLRPGRGDRLLEGQPVARVARAADQAGEPEGEAEGVPARRHPEGRRADRPRPVQAPARQPPEGRRPQVQRRHQGQA